MAFDFIVNGCLMDLTTMYIWAIVKLFFYKDLELV